jgi:hypothetical protein
MPRAGLTSELRSGPSDLSTADLNESINAVTCGSLQMLDGFVAGIAVVPAGGVTLPGETVSETGVGVAMNNVEVGKASRVGVGGTGVDGNVQAANNVNPIKMIERVLVFIVISSFGNYIFQYILMDITEEIFQFVLSIAESSSVSIH